MKTFISRRNEWLSLDGDYKEYLTIARKTLERIPSDSSKLGDLNEKDSRCYHVSCFCTNYLQIRLRLNGQKKLIDAQENKACDEPIEPPARKISRRIQLQQEIPPTDQPEPSSSGILPRKCLICNKYGAIYVKTSR